MGFLAAWFGILFAGVLILLLGPLLHYWGVKKLVVFEDPSIKKSLLFFFAAWLVVSSVYARLAWLAVEGAVSNLQEKIFMNKMIGKIGLVVTLIAQTLLGRWNFNESYVRAFMASVVYIVSAALLLAVLLVIGLLSGLELFSALSK